MSNDEKIERLCEGLTVPRIVRKPSPPAQRIVRPTNSILPGRPKGIAPKTQDNPGGTKS